MADERNTTVQRIREKTIVKHQGVSSGIYGMAFIGAAIYYIQHATSFGDGIIGFIKAIFWPAVVIYKVLETWNM